MVLILENENEAFLKAVKAMAKAFNVKITAKKQNWQDEYKELLKDYKAGKIKSFKSAREAFKDAKLIK